MSKNCFTFEQLCIRKECGFSFDFDNMFRPCDLESFDDVIFKLICKINTSLLLLTTHGEEIEHFTLIALPLSHTQNSQASISEDVPVKSYQKRRSMKIQPPKTCPLNCTALENAWDYLSSVGWHCLQSLALLQPESIPDNGSRKYSLYQFTTCVMDVIRANYMFQKHTSSFHHETLEMFDETEIKEAKQAVFGLLWKRASPSSRKKAAIAPVPQRNADAPAVIEPLSTKKKKVTYGRTSAKLTTQDSDSAEDMDVDGEISFKDAGEEKVLTSDATISTPKGGTRTPKEVDSPPPSDVTLSFDVSVSVPKKGRASMAARKSLSSEWPEEERQSIIQLFDDFNPDVSEQTKIALTCKYVSLQLGKDLPSKLLYQWIQKKGREITRTINTFSIPENSEQKEVALKFFHNLNPLSSESARVAFTLKYLDAQYGMNVTSKQLFTWLIQKPSASKKKRKRL